MEEEEAIGAAQLAAPLLGADDSGSPDASLLRHLYAGHALARWGARMWEFSVGLYMIRIWPGSLLFTAIYGVVESSSVAVFGPMVGALVDRLTYLQVGKNYVCSEWKQELITFSHFLERMWSTGCPSNLTYLAQHPLFEQIKELSEDIMVPDYCYAGGRELQSLNAWFGPHGTVTPLHHDPHHNILAQVLGRKYIRLYPASVSEELYPHTETMLSNTSQVDLDNMDLKEFPKVEDLDFMDCILEEGDLLYIPPKWWHYVRSLSTSFSVSFWWRATVQPSGGS